MAAPTAYGPPMGRSEISDMASECLRNSPYRNLRGIVCRCSHGVLVLKGRLPCFYHKQIAQEIVAGVRGVTQVINEIEVQQRNVK